MPGIDRAKFEELARAAEKNCPVSKVLNAEITMDFTLARSEIRVSKLPMPVSCPGLSLSGPSPAMHVVRSPDGIPGAGSMRR